MSRLNLNGFKIPLDMYTSATEFVVVGQSEIIKFENNKPTGEVVGIKLELHDGDRLERFDCKVPGEQLPFKGDAIESKTIRVSLVNPTITPYGEFVLDKDGKPKSINIFGSVKADGYKELKKA